MEPASTHPPTALATSSTATGEAVPSKMEHILGGASVEALGQFIVKRDIRKILVLIGAGASVAAGIPDFRSPGTGLYANLAKYDLDEPSDAFSLDLLRQSPSVFYTIANEMNLWPGSYKPTAVHHFVKLLSDQGRLLRCCTQNIDGLERAAGVPEELLVEAHGSFRTASCIECHQPFDIERNHKDASTGCISLCDECGGIVKPDVVFFGEQLPERFFRVLYDDTKDAQLVIIIGTSLQVRPFALLPLHVGDNVPRVLVNMERVGGRMFLFPDDDEYIAQMLLATEAADDHGDSTSGSDAAHAEGLEAATAEREGRSHRRRDGVSGGVNEESGDEDAESIDEADADPVSGEHAVVAKMDELLRCQEQANGDERYSDTSGSSSSDGFLEYEEFTSQYRQTTQFRDLFVKGDCQLSIKRLASSLGLGASLAAAVAVTVTKPRVALPPEAPVSSDSFL